jgi:Polyketide cyclase / dehydrase and lipid transport
MELPRIDEHSTVLAAPPERAWQAVLTVVGGSPRLPAQLVARVLGCADREAIGTLPDPGATVLGFHVARAEPPRLLALEGSHRFAQYALTFSVESAGDGGSRVNAETHARFPGTAGRAYRALVIGSRGHVVSVRAILARVRRQAESRG